MEKTSGSYLDRINSFLEETENDVLKDILAEKNEGSVAAKQNVQETLESAKTA
jgi:hypothetical protein